MKKYIVYVHINKYNNKKYVGITSHKNPNRRWVNGKGYHHNEYFVAAIKKYTFDGFEHVIWSRGLSKEEAELIERDLIKSFKSNQREYGYNIQDGGKVSTPHSEETKVKLMTMSKTKKKVEQIDIKTNEVIAIFNSVAEAARSNNYSRQNISKVCNGKIISAYGYKWRFSDCPIEHSPCKKSKSVEQIDLNTGEVINTFISLTEAAKHVSGLGNRIGEVCNGKRDSMYGYCWRFYNA